MKKSILVVDDEELERELIRQIFEADYNVIMASNGKDALIQLSRHYNEIVIILLDLSMPVLNGYQVLQVLNASELYRSIPVAMITATDSQDLAVACYAMGVVSVINKPISVKVVRKQINNIIDIYENSKQTEKNLTNRLARMNYFYGNLVEAICSIAEFRAYESGTHVKRMKALTKIVAEEYMNMYPESGLTHEKIEVLVQAAAIHDIGKIAIPDGILFKTSTLTKEEEQVLMSHTTKGCEIISTFADQGDESFKISYDVCRYHHERYDGNGYPDGLAGDSIPLSAQIVSIVHEYENLISERIYKQAYDKKTAFDKIISGKCGSFSPNLLHCFQHAKSKIEALTNAKL